tara:strand:+ start:501 stop:998 length:498 start_codon:yes stop_codon:yes gene_type:complete
MSKIKKVKQIPQKIKEIKKEKEKPDSEEKLENKIESVNIKEEFVISHSAQVSPTLKKEKNLESISIQTPIISEKTESKNEETSRDYFEKENNAYESTSPKNSSEEPTYELPKSQEIIREIKNDNFQKEEFSRIPKSQVKNERNNFEEIPRREYNSERDNKRKYLM